MVDATAEQASKGTGPDAPGDNRSPLVRWLARRLPVLLIALLLVTLATVLLWRRVFISIEPGEAGVLYRFFTGTVTGRVYGEGLHVILHGAL